jgi:hypothetical protein
MSRRRICNLVDRPRRGLRADHGIALLIVITALILILGLTSALILTTAVEMRIAAAFRDDGLAVSAADAAVSRAFIDLRNADLNATLGGGFSPFVDGPSGDRPLPDGTVVNLDRETSDLRCGKPAGCSDVDITTPAEDRPWGGHNPRWQLYGFGPASAMFPADPSPPAVYLVIWIADDPADDDDPYTDAAAGEPGAEVFMVAVSAYGTRGIQRTVEYVVERVGTQLRTLARHERRP